MDLTRGHIEGVGKPARGGDRRLMASDGGDLWGRDNGTRGPREGQRGNKGGPGRKCERRFREWRARDEI